MRKSDVSDTHIDFGDLQQAQGVCAHHGELVLVVKEMHRDLKDVLEMTSKINHRLIGDMGDNQTQGFLVDFEQMKEFKKKMEEAEVLDKTKRISEKFNFVTRIVYWLVGIIVAGLLEYTTDFIGALARLVNK